MNADGAALPCAANDLDNRAEICSVAAPLKMFSHVGTIYIRSVYGDPHVYSPILLMMNVIVTNTIVFEIAIAILAPAVLRTFTSGDPSFWGV